ncbi:MAG: hypothetical protein AAF280_15090 [Pseudomonadota bacterium]
MFAVLAGTAAAGLAAGWLVWGRAPSPAVVVAEFLEDRCLPYVTDGSLNVAGLTSISLAGTPAFAEEDRAVSVSFMERSGIWRCHISDTLALWTAEESAAVFAAVEAFATDHVAPMNDGALVRHDATSEGVGDPQVVWRRPTKELGFFVMFVRHRFPEHQRITSVSFGQSEFIRPVDDPEASDV